MTGVDLPQEPSGKRGLARPRLALLLLLTLLADAQVASAECDALKASREFIEYMTLEQSVGAVVGAKLCEEGNQDMCTGLGVLVRRAREMMRRAGSVDLCTRPELARVEDDFGPKLRLAQDRIEVIIERIKELKIESKLGRTTGE